MITQSTDTPLAVTHTPFYHVAVIPGVARGMVRTNLEEAHKDASAWGKVAKVVPLTPSEAAKYIAADRRQHTKTFYELQVPTRH